MVRFAVQINRDTQLGGLAFGSIVFLVMNQWSMISTYFIYSQSPQLNLEAAKNVFRMLHFAKIPCPFSF